MPGLTGLLSKEFLQLVGLSALIITMFGRIFQKIYIGWETTLFLCLIVQPVFAPGLGPGKDRLNPALYANSELKTMKDKLRGRELYDVCKIILLYLANLTIQYRHGMISDEQPQRTMTIKEL